MSRAKLRHWFVITPQYTTYYNAESLEPPEVGCDVVSVEARTKREAKILGVKKLRKVGNWISDSYSDGENPYKGIKVEESVCSHGLVHWCEPIDNPTIPCIDGPCIECDKIYLREIREEIGKNPEQYAKDFWEDELKTFKDAWGIDYIG